MTDIVERLRIKDATGISISMLMEEAADEIERLRARVADLEDQLLQALGGGEPGASAGKSE